MKTLLTTILATGCVFGAFAESAADWTVPKTYENGRGGVFRYRWAEPAKTESGKKYPLVVLMHGAGERGTNNIAQLKWGGAELLGYMRKCGIEGFFVAGQVPGGKQWVDTPWANTSHRMNARPSETMALQFELLDKLVAELPIDRSRIYVTGVSMGGYGTWDAIQRRPDFFAAALPCCGGGDTHLAWKIRDIPIWAWHGDCDNAVPVVRSREMVAALWSVDGRIRYTEVPGCGHGVWNNAYACEDALKWFFSQKR